MDNENVYHYGIDNTTCGLFSKFMDNVYNTLKDEGFPKSTRWATEERGHYQFTYVWGSEGLIGGLVFGCVTMRGVIPTWLIKRLQLPINAPLHRGHIVTEYFQRFVLTKWKPQNRRTQFIEVDEEVDE